MGKIAAVTEVANAALGSVRRLPRFSWTDSNMMQTSNRRKKAWLQRRTRPLELTLQILSSVTGSAMVGDFHNNLRERTCQRQCISFGSLSQGRRGQGQGRRIPCRKGNENWVSRRKLCVKPVQSSDPALNQRVVSTKGGRMMDGVKCSYGGGGELLRVSEFAKAVTQQPDADVSPGPGSDMSTRLLLQNEQTTTLRVHSSQPNMSRR